MSGPGGHVVDSPDGASLRAGDRGQIVCNGLSYWLSHPSRQHGRRVVIDGVEDDKTEWVRLLWKDGGRLYQRNRERNWWYHDPSAGWPWVACDDPRLGETEPPDIIDPPDPEEPPPDIEQPPEPPVDPGGERNASVDFAASTGRTLRASVFGIGTGALADNDYRLADDDLVVEQLARIAPRCFRLHAGHRMAHEVANGNMDGFDRWVTASARFLPPGALQIIGVGPVFDDDSLSPERHAADAVSLAMTFMEAGHAQTVWEVGNECEGLGVERYCEHYVAIADALHEFNPSYKIGGTCGAWWGSINIEEFVRRVGAHRVQFFCFHAYPVGSQDAGEIYGKAVAWGDVASARGALRGAGVADSVPIRLLEWNMDGADHGGVWGNPQQITHVGAVYMALLLQSAFEQDPNFDAGACWDAVADSYFGQVGPAPDYDNNVIVPSGIYLGMAGRTMAGGQVVTETAEGKLRMLAVVEGKGFSLQLVNYDEQREVVVNPEFRGARVTALTGRYVVGKGHEGGTEERAELPIAVPAECVVIVTGTLA